MRVAKLSTSGPAFAALLQESATSKLPFDGLLIGDFPSRTANPSREIPCNYEKSHSSTCSHQNAMYNTSRR